MTGSVDPPSPESLHPRVRFVWGAGSLAVAAFVLVVGWLVGLGVMVVAVVLVIVWSAPVNTWD
jgi:hypothetical protein